MIPKYYIMIFDNGKKLRDSSKIMPTNVKH